MNRRAGSRCDRLFTSLVLFPLQDSPDYENYFSPIVTIILTSHMSQKTIKIGATTRKIYKNRPFLRHSPGIRNKSFPSYPLAQEGEKAYTNNSEEPICSGLYRNIKEASLWDLSKSNSRATSVS